MVDELYYEKNQLLMDAEGELWVLVDILESKSLLSKKAKPTLNAFIKKDEEKAKIKKVSFKDFCDAYTPLLHKDKRTVDTIMKLEDSLDLIGIHPCVEEN